MTGRAAWIPVFLVGGLGVATRAAEAQGEPAARGPIRRPVVCVAEPGKAIDDGGLSMSAAPVDRPVTFRPRPRGEVMLAGWEGGSRSISGRDAGVSVGGRPGQRGRWSWDEIGLDLYVGSGPGVTLRSQVLSADPGFSLGGPDALGYGVALRYTRLFALRAEPGVSVGFHGDLAFGGMSGDRDTGREWDVGIRHYTQDYRYRFESTTALGLVGGAVAWTDPTRRAVVQADFGFGALRVETDTRFHSEVTWSEPAGWFATALFGWLGPVSGPSGTESSVTRSGTQMDVLACARLGFQLRVNFGALGRSGILEGARLGARLRLDFFDVSGVSRLHFRGETTDHGTLDPALWFAVSLGATLAV